MAEDRYTRATRSGDAYRREPPPADQALDPLTELARLIGQGDPFADPRRPAPRDARDTYADDRTARRQPAAYQEPAYQEPRADTRGYTEPAYDEQHYDPPTTGQRAYDPRYDAAPARYADEPGYDSGVRPNDPYDHTEGMFPREPQGFAAEPRYNDDYATDPRYPAAPEPAAYDPRYDDPRGYERREPGFDAGAADARAYDRAGYDAQGYGQPAYEPAPAYAEPPRAAAPVGRAAAVTPQRYDDPAEVDTYMARLRGDPAGRDAAPAARSPHPGDIADLRDGGHDIPAVSGMPAPYYDDGYGHPDDASEGEPAPAPRRPKSGVMTIVAAVLALAVIGSAGAFAYRSLFSSGGPAKPAPVIRADSGPNKVVPAAPSGAGDNKQIYDRLADKSQNEKVISREEQPVEIRDASRPPTPRMVFPNSAAATGSAPAAAPVMPQAQQPAGQALASAGSGEPKRIKTIPIRSDQGSPPAAAAPARPGAARAAADPNAPMSLTPNASSAPAGAAPAPRAAAVAPPAAIAPVASANASGGGYVVQISAQKTEGEAQSAFRSMQSRYPNQLGGRAPIIRRKDTGTGTMYGAQVGPFASREEAIQMCEGLKTAGGSCFVQRN